jgi:lysyl-tRNA synthetase class 1
LPASAGELTGAQHSYLSALADAAEGADPAGGEAWQSLIFETSKQLDIKAGEAFGAIYRAFLDRSNGPRAGWLLASLDRSFVIRRLREAAA